MNEKTLPPLADADIEKLLPEVRHRPGMHGYECYSFGDVASAVRDYAERVAVQAPSAVPADCDVRRILVRIVPNLDGMDEEVYANSVADVEELLSKVDQELEEWQLGIRQLPAAPVPAVPEIDYEALIAAAYKRDRRWAQGTNGCIAFKCGAEWFRTSLLAAPQPAQQAAQQDPTKIPRHGFCDHPDDEAAERFCAAMKWKLAQAREKGRGGWQECSQEELSRMLREHVEKGDPRDVANFCMFLHALGYGILPAQPNVDDSLNSVRAHLSHINKLLDGATQQAPVADAALKALFAKHFGKEEGWLGGPGSWFIEGVRAARSELSQQVPSVPDAPGVPYGHVTVVKRPGCAAQHWFYRHPETPYLDNAAECVTVYTRPPGSKVATAQPVAVLTMFDIRSQTGTVDLRGGWGELRVGDSLYAAPPEGLQGEQELEEARKKCAALETLALEFFRALAKFDPKGAQGFIATLGTGDERPSGFGWTKS